MVWAISCPDSGTNGSIQIELIIGSGGAAGH